MTNRAFALAPLEDYIGRRGTIVSGLTTLVVECSSLKRRTLPVTLLYLGYPIGGVLGGLVAQQHIEHAGWQAFFLYGGILTGALIPVALLRLPESLDYLLTRQPKSALAGAKALATRVGCPPPDALPPKSPAAAKTPPRLLISNPNRMQTASLRASFFVCLLVTSTWSRRSPPEDHSATAST